MKYDNKEFQRLWNEIGIEACIKRYDVTRTAVIIKACELRKSGMNLKRYKSTPGGYIEAKTKINIEEETRIRKIEYEDKNISQEDFEVKDEVGV